jgi:hypothetical protein
VTRVIIGDFATGHRFLDLPFVSCSWERRRNAAEQLTAKVTLTDPDVQALGLRSATSPLKGYMAIVEGDYFMGAGPIWRRDYDKDAGTLEIKAAGVWSYLDHRTLTLAEVLTTDTSQFVIDDPANPGQTIPNPALQWSAGPYDFATLARFMALQGGTWPVANVPIVFPAGVVAGPHERHYDAVDFKSAGEALTDLTKVDGGPDIEFRPQWRSDRLGIEWYLRVGTDAQPELRSDSVHVWDLSVPDPSMKGLTVAEDGTNLTSVAWVTGGRSSNQTLLSRSVSTTLTNFGYPLTETVDSSHSSVVEPSTLDYYASEIVRTNSVPGELWEFSVRKDLRPMLGEYSIGDRCLLKIQGDPYIPDGDYVREIAGLSGDEGDWVRVITAEVFG